MTPARRVVLLGASNLARALPTVIAAAQGAWGQPLDLLAALGHGRGYGKTSRVLGRVLPPIAECGLWQSLAERTAAPTAVLLTDIGNDLVLGAPPQQVVHCVETCLERLAQFSQQMSITQLPMASLQRLGRMRYSLLRTLFFPRSQLCFEDAWAHADEVNRAVIRLAERFGAKCIAPASEWFGFDPIHIRYSQQTSAWREIFTHWSSSESDQRLTPRHSSWDLLGLRPHYRKWFGIEQHQPQPARCLKDGTTISLF